MPIGFEIDLEPLMEEFDRTPNWLKFTIREHKGKRDHLDIVIGYNDMCIDFFTTRIKSIDELFEEYEAEYLGIGRVRKCKQYFESRIGKKHYLTGNYKGQWWYNVIKGKAIKEKAHHTFDLIINTPSTLKNITFDLWGFPSNDGDRQWVIKRKY